MRRGPTARFRPLSSQNLKFSVVNTSAITTNYTVHTSNLAEMGRKNNYRGKNKKQNNRQQPVRDDRDGPNANGWNDVVKENDKWEKYYRDLKLMSDEEFELFKLACQSPLPLTFRITGSRKHASEILDLFKEKHLQYLTDLKLEDNTSIPPPKSLDFYPNELAWQIDVAKSVMRKNENFSKTQRFLVIENDVGNISRQEAVSMIPPLLLDVQSHHKVLDMCAAPGSKTAQLIEALHADTESPTGFVVANDSDYKRAHMLVHQIKRLNSPNMIVVNHDAQLFPKTRLGGEFVKFDRILCDVPCSGDGTMRKNVQIWTKWQMGDGLGLNPLQYKILQRGIDLLADGGRLVYSTCSLNPIENEAVVAHALRNNKNIRLIKAQLPGLKSTPGLKQWTVIGKDGEAKERGAEGYYDGFFAPNEEEAKVMNLEDCIRVYPHMQNTGGFFITVFEKVNTEQPAEQPKKKAKVEETATPVEVSTEATPVAEESVEKKTIKPKREKLSSYANDGNEPFVFLEKDHEELAKCWEFYGINNDDTFITESCFVRNGTGEPARIIYLSNPTVKEYLTLNEEKLKIAHSGVKFFHSQRTDLKCKWRIQSECLPMVKSKLSQDRVLDCPMAFFEKLLKEAFPKYTDLEQSDPEIYATVSKMESGCAFIKIKREGDLEELLFPIWVGTKCLNLMLSKKETYEVLYRVFGIETDASAEYKQGPTLDKSTAKIGEAKADEEEETPVTEETPAVAEE